MFCYAYRVIAVTTCDCGVLMFQCYLSVLQVHFSVRLCMQVYLHNLQIKFVYQNNCRVKVKVTGAKKRVRVFSSRVVCSAFE